MPGAVIQVLAPHEPVLMVSRAQAKFTAIVRRAQNSSAVGPSGNIPPKV